MLKKSINCARQKINLSSKAEKVEGDFPIMTEFKKFPQKKEVLDLENISDNLIYSVNTKSPAKPKSRPSLNPDVKLSPRLPEIDDRPGNNSPTNFQVRNIPNPFSAKGAKFSETSQKDFYKNYFNDRMRLADGEKLESTEIQDTKKQKYLVTPKDYWIRPDYKPPAIDVVPDLSNANELVFIMKNEIYRIRKELEKSVPVDDTNFHVSLIQQAVRLVQSGPRNSPRLALRTLEFSSSLGIALPDEISALIGSLSLSSLKPAEFFFIFQALGRLRIRDARMSALLKRSAFCWGALLPKHLVKVANAIAKLGGDDVEKGKVRWTDSLAVTLSHGISSGRVKGKDLLLLKGLTVVEILGSVDGGMGVLDYLVMMESNCEKPVKGLVLVEFWLRLIKPDLWNKIPENVKKWLKTPIPDEQEPKDSEKTQFFTQVLHSIKYLNVITNVMCGPFQTDFFFPQTNTLLELAPMFQFYQGSKTFTTAARLRHQLLRAMGFKLLVLPYHTWQAVQEEHRSAWIAKEYQLT